MLMAFKVSGQTMRNFVYLAVAGIALLGRPAVAGVREDVLAAMQRCAVIPDDRTWLDCTYGAQQLMRAKLGLKPAPDFQQHLVPSETTIPAPAPVIASSAPRPAAASSPRRQGGLMDMFSGKTKPVAVSTLVAVRYDVHGAFIATLENGQVWRQVNVQEGFPRARLTIGSKVTILPGAMWSYNLKTSDSHTYKVDRDA
jgi:hypothetical protein